MRNEPLQPRPMPLRPWVTGLGVLAVLTLAVLVESQQAGVEPLTRLRYPAESAGRMVERHFASLPVLRLMQRHLLRPHGLSLSQAFGPTVTDVGAGRFLSIVLVILAVEWAGSLLIA